MYYTVVTISLITNSTGKSMIPLSLSIVTLIVLAATVDNTYWYHQQQGNTAAVGR